MKLEFFSITNTVEHLTQVKSGHVTDGFWEQIERTGGVCEKTKG